MIGNFLNYFEKIHSYIKTEWLLFGQLLQKIWLLFTRSGHTGDDIKESNFSPMIELPFVEEKQFYSLLNEFVMTDIGLGIRYDSLTKDTEM